MLLSCKLVPLAYILLMQMHLNSGTDQGKNGSGLLSCKNDIPMSYHVTA